MVDGRRSTVGRLLTVDGRRPTAVDCRLPTVDADDGRRATVD
jgi:hypothetical protein